MLREAQSYLSIQPSLAIITGVAVSAIVLGLNLLGDALRDVLDPRTLMGPDARAADERDAP